MIYLTYDLNDERVQYLIRTDTRLGQLIRYIGTSELALEEDGFRCLVKYIIGQQISDKSRETIWQRMCNTLDDITPSTALRTDDSVLREMGIPYRKVKCIKTLATEIRSGRLDFEKLLPLTNEEIIAKLTALSGIGNWTAEMYLIFSLGRENVFSRGDGTIKRTIQWMYNLDKLPTGKEVAAHFCNWADYATIASLFLWKSILLGLTLNPFDKVICKLEE